MRTPQEIKETLRKNADYYTKATIEKTKVGAMIGRLNENLGGGIGRRKVLAWIFCDDDTDELHRNQMSNGQWLAIYDWIAFHEEDGVWYTGMDFSLECVTLYNHLKGLGKL